MAACAVAFSASAAVSFSGYTSIPAEGEVTEITSIEITFPGCDEIEINDAEGIYMVDGNYDDVAGSAKVTYGTNVLKYTPDEPITAPGTYTLCIGTEILAGYVYNGDDADYLDNPDEIYLQYTIGSQQGGGVNFDNAEVDPKQGSVTSLETIKISYPNAPEVYFYDRSKVTMTRDGAPVAIASMTDGFGIEVKLESAQTESGEYVLTIPALELGGYTETDGKDNETDLVYKWTIAAPVAYDLTLELSSPTNPNADGELSAEKQLISFFFASPETGLVAASGTEDNVTIREIDGDFERSGHLRKAFGLDASKTYFSVEFGAEPRYNGKYEIVIAKGAFGNDVWASNPEAGRTNDEITLTFTLVDGAERVFYTIEATEITPAETTVENGNMLTEFTVKFDTDVTLAPEAHATLAGKTADFNESAVIASTGDNRTFTVKFETVPTEDGVYVFNIAQGAFVGTEGNMSVEINKEYTLTSSNGVDMIETVDGETVVYNLQGVRVNAENLPAGIYIVNGKKQVIR